MIEGNDVRLVNASAAEHEDPLLEQFLGFLGCDMQANMRHVVAFPASLLERARAAAAGVQIDHDAEIEGDTVI